MTARSPSSIATSATPSDALRLPSGMPLAAAQCLLKLRESLAAPNATLASVFGCQVYDDTLAAPVADQGVSYHYFGGSNSVVNGTFTVAWAAPNSGIWNITV